MQQARAMSQRPQIKVELGRARIVPLDMTTIKVVRRGSRIRITMAPRSMQMVVV